MSVFRIVRPGILFARFKRLATSKHADTADSSTRNVARMRLLGRETGNALIEFAFVLPMMALVITGLYSFGVTLNNQIALTQATGAGAQFLQTLRGNTTDPCADTLSAMENAAPSLRPSSLNVTLTMNGVVASGNSCPGQVSNLKQGQSVTVSTTYPCTLLVYGLNLGSSCQLSAQVTEFEY